MVHNYAMYEKYKATLYILCLLVIFYIQSFAITTWKTLSLHLKPPLSYRKPWDQRNALFFAPLSKSDRFAVWWISSETKFRTANFKTLTLKYGFTVSFYMTIGTECERNLFQWDVWQELNESHLIITFRIWKRFLVCLLFWISLHFQLKEETPWNHIESFLVCKNIIGDHFLKRS